VSGTEPLRASAWGAVASLFASGGTLVCCALPALLVALGAGAVLSSLVAVLPQIVWLSEHKAAVFGTAAAMLALNVTPQRAAFPNLCRRTHDDQGR